MHKSPIIEDLEEEDNSSTHGYRTATATATAITLLLLMCHHRQSNEVQKPSKPRFSDANITLSPQIPDRI
jgi:hypothetical protein